MHSSMDRRCVDIGAAHYTDIGRLDREGWRGALARLRCCPGTQQRGPAEGSLCRLRRCRPSAARTHGFRRHRQDRHRDSDRDRGLGDEQEQGRGQGHGSAEIHLIARTQARRRHVSVAHPPRDAGSRCSSRDSVMMVIRTLSNERGSRKTSVAGEQSSRATRRWRVIV